MQPTSHIQNTQKVITAKAAAKVLGIAPDYVSKLCREGKLKGELIDNVWHVEVSSIDAYEHSREVAKAERAQMLANERRSQIRAYQFDNGNTIERFLLRASESRQFALASFAVGLLFVVASVTLGKVVSGYGWLPASQSAALARVESPFFAGEMPSVSLGEIASGVSNFFASLFAPKQPTQPQYAQTNAPVAQLPATTTKPVATATKPATVVTNTYPVIERTLERVVTNTISGVSQDAFDQALNALRSQIASISSGSSGVVLPYAPATRIDKLSGVAITGGTITSATISGGSISGVSLSTSDLSGIVAIANGGTGTSSAPTYGKVLLGNASGAYDLVATSSLGITSGSGTFVGLTDTPSSIAAGDIFYGNGSSALVALPIGSNGQVLKISGGVPTWGSDLQGSGGAGAWATTTDNLALYPADTTQVVIVGNNATTTTGNIFEVTGNALFRNQVTAYRTITAPTFTATSTLAASTFPYASSTALTVSGTGYFGTASTSNLTISGIASGNLLKTTTGGAVTAAVAGTDFENALTFTYPLTRSTNTISLAFGTTTSNTWGGTQTFTNTPVLGSLSGLVGSNNGALYQIATSTDFVTSVAAGSGISLSGTAGAVTITNTIGYPFPSNATTTTLTLSGGLLTPTTTIGVLNATSSATLASTTLSGNTLFTNATTTSFAISNISSGSLLKTTTGGAIIAAVAGTDYTTFGYLFPSNATTTQLAFNGGATFAGATTTALAVTGSTTIQTLNLTNALGAAFGGTGSSTLTGLLVGNGTGALQTATVSSPLALSGTTLSIQQATAAQSGYLSTTDWNTFNNKISSTSLSAGAGISYDSSTGVIANLIGYPFPSNATTTTLTLSGGLLTPTTTIGVLNATSSATLASTTLSGNTLLTNATSTNFFATLASTTNLFANGATTTALAITNISSGSLLKTTTGGAVIAAVAGTDYANFGYLFPSNATTTSIAFNGGLTATGATLASTTLTGNLVFDTATGTNATTTSLFSTIARFTTASTTNLVVSGLGNGSTQCLQINGSGTVSGTGSACGAGGGSFDYPFPGNATTTTLTLSGGLLTPTTTIGVLNATSSATLASTTLTGNTLLTNATSTNFAATNITIGTLSGLLKATSGVVSAAVGGTDYTTPSGVATSIAAAFPFTATTNFGAAANSTSTPIWFTNGLQASSTSQFAYASTTALTVNGSFYGASLSACDTNTQKLMWSNGQFSCATDQNTGGGGGSFPFSADNNYGQLVYSTSTPTLWLKSGIFASSTSHFVDADFTTATTTNLAVTGVTSSLLKTNSIGQLVAAVAGTDYTNFGYLFPNNATTTFLSFGGGASTTQLSVFNRAYFGATGTTTIDSTGAITVTSNSANTFPYASSTALSVSAALYTPVTSALLKTDSSGKLTAAVAGTDYQTFAWPFTPTTNYGAATNSTSTAAWFQGGLQASSTSRFVTADFSGVITSTATGANTLPYASTTALTVSGSFYGASLSTCNTGADKLLWNNGTFSCGTDAGASGTTEINWAFFNGSGVRVATSSNQVLIGFTSTSTNSKLEVVGGATFDSATTTALYASGITSLAGNVGLGTTTPYSKLSVVGGNVLQVASGNPTLAATVATTSTTHSYGSVVSGRYLYSADYEAGLRIIDISNPKTAASVGSYNTSMTHARGVAVAGKYAYVADDTAGLVILDVSNPASIKLVGSYAGINAFGIALSGRYVFIPDNSGGVMRILDVSDPTSPRLVSSLQPNVASQPLAVVVQGKFAYLGDNGTSRVYAIDISNPASPSIAGSYIGNSPIGLYVTGKYLYVADNGGGLYILNIATSNGNPTLVGTLNGTAQYYGVQVAGDYAYIADRAGNLVVADVSNPASPTSVGTLAVGDQPNGVTVSGKYAYVAANGNSTKIVDINGAQLPTASIGAIETNTANIGDNLTVGGDVSLGGGLDVGISGIFSRGTIAAYVASSTQTNPTVASFIGGNVGIGTTSPYAALSVAGQSVFNYITATGTTASSFAGGVNLNGGATSTAFAVTGSTTISGVTNIGGQLNANLSAILASTTLTGSSLFTNATTTSFAISNISSGSILKTTTGGAVIAAVAGTDYVTGTGLASAFPFTATTNFGAAANSTSTAIWFQQGLQASSTAQLGMVNVFGTINFASTSTTTLAQFNGESLIAYNVDTASHAFGNSAGGLLSTNNTAIGSGALQNATSTGDNSNTAVGSLALRGSTSNFAGIQNTAVGRNALLTLSTGSDNSALGVGALGSLTSGSSNAAVGTDTFSNLTTGSFNSAFGVSAGGSITGDSNSLFGYNVGGGAGANRLTIVGSAAGNAVTGDNNTFLGYNSGRGITTGYANIMLGAHLSNSAILTTGSGNVGIGNELFFASSTNNNQLNIGNILFGTLPATSTAFAEATTGAIGVATSSPFAKFAIQSNNGDTATTLFAIGSSTASATTTLFSISNTGTAYFGGTVAVATTSPWARASIDTSSLAASIPSFVVGSSTRTDLVVTQAGRVGIGTAAPGATLEVAGSVTISNSGSLTVGGATRVSATGYFFAGSGTAGSPGFAFGNSTNTGLFLDTSDLGFSAAGTERLRITSAGNIGIGTSSPYRQLSVGNSAVFGGDVLAASFTATSSASLASTTLTGSSLFTNATTTSFAISGISSGSILKTTTGGAVIAAVAGTDFVTGAGLTAAFPFTATTNFGAAANSTSTAIWFQQGLQASSTARFSNVDTYGILNFATTSANASSTLASFQGQTFLTASTTGFNTGVGLSALANLTSGNYNTAVGNSALQSNTTGQKNTGIGEEALTGNTTGSSNSAFGYIALSANRTGSNNAAFGDNALSTYSDAYGISSGSTAVGQAALQNLLSGFGNTALGHKANWSGQRATSTTYLGTLTSSSENVSTSTAIGAGARVTASNSLVLGGLGQDSVFAGVGTTSPFARFSVQANPTDSISNLTLFAIGSSTASATTTLFSISNLGILNLNPHTGTSTAAAFRGTSFLISDGDDQLGLGIGALANASNNIGSIAIGRDALHDDTQGSNVAIGNGALAVNTTGNSNSALGENALNDNISGSENVALGVAALNLATSSSGNVAIGNSALSSFKSSTTNTYNTAVGYYAMSGNSYGVRNSTLGALAAQNITGSNNVVLGYFAAGNANAVSNSVLLGYQAGSTLNSGDGNILIGASLTASNLSDGAGNIGIGNNLFFPSAAGNNQINIAGLLFGTAPATSTTFRLPTSGSLGVGTSSPFAKFAIQSNNGDTTTTLFAIGSSTASATTTLFSVNNTGLISLNPNLSATTTLVNLLGTSFLQSSQANSSLALGNYTGGVGQSANVAIGDYALTSNTTGTSNTAVGTDALLSNLGGQDNTAVGFDSLYSNTTGNRNVGVGYNALYYNSTGTSNIGIGYRSAESAVGSYNIGIGEQTFLSGGAGTSRNVAVGAFSATNLKLGQTDNVLLGFAAGGSLMNAYANIIVGSDPNQLGNLANGGNNILIGNNNYATSSNASNFLNIGGLVFGSLPATTSSFKLPTSGSLGVGTSSPFAKFAIQSNNGDTATTLFAIGSSTASATSTLFSISNTGSTTLFQIPSSILKTDSNGTIIAAVAGTDYVTGAGLTAAFPFTATTFGGTAANSTSTLIGFTNGVYALASSTIGAGGQTTGLTISGGATTTGNAYIDGAIGVGVQNTTAGSVRTNTSLTVGTLAAINGTSGNLLSFGGIASGVNNIITANIGNLTSGNAIDFTSSGSASTAATGDIIVVSRTRTLATSLADTNNFLNLTRINTANGNGNNFRNTGDLVKLVSNCNQAGGKCFDESSILSIYQFATSSATTSPVFNLQSGGLGKLATFVGTSTGDGVSIQIASTSANAFALDVLVNNGANSAFRVTGTQAAGIASTSPFARLSLHANPTDQTLATTLFAIGSSTASATTTLFSISNTGSTTLFQIPSSILKTDSNGTIIAAVAGTDYVNPSGLASAFPFTATTFGSTAANSTSTLIGFTNGIYALASSTIGAGGQTTGLTISGGATTTGNAYFGGQIFNSDGSASAPAVSFLTDTGLGMYRAANDTLGFATNGTARLYISNSEIDALYPVTSQVTRGFYLSTTAVINASAPPYAFDSDTNTGMRSSAADTLEFVTGGVDRVTVTSTGNFGVGSSSPFSRLTLHANNGDTNTTLFAIGSSTASATTTLFSVLNTGAVGIGSTSPSGIFGIETSGTSGRLVEIRNTSTSNWAGGTSGGFLVLRSDAGGSATGNYVINYLLNGTSQQFGVDASGRTHVSGSANASNPGLAFIGDTDTGLFSASGTNIIGFSTGGRERARLTATGGFTIGTSTSYATTTIWSNSLTGNALEIVNNASTTLLSVSSAGFGTTTVSGLSISGSATSTSNVGFDISSGCFAVNGTCLASATFSYPFPSNATSTLLSFTGGILATASSTIGNGAQAGGLTINGGATTTGSFVVTGSYASTTKFYANGLTTCQSGSVLTYDGAGTFGCATDQTAAGGWPFTPTTFGSTAANATSTLVGFTQGIYALASSTIGNGTQTGGLTISGGATTTATSTLAGLLVTSGNVGIGTLAPSYLLDVSGTLHASGAVTFDSTLTTGAITINSGGAGTFGLSVNPSGLVSYNSSDTIFGEHRFAFGGTTLARIMANGRVGIGTTTPYAKLSVFAGEDYLAAAESTLFAIGSTTAGTATTTLFSILSSGNVGIGTSSPGSRLSLTQAASVSQFTLAYDSSNATYMRTDSVGDLWIVPSGNDARMTNGNLWVCTGGSITSNACPSGTPSGQGNLIVQTAAGIGTSTPSSALTVYSTSANAAIFGDNTAAVAVGQGTSEGTIQGYTTTSGTATANLNLQPSGGLLGVATSSPWGLFSINPTASNGTAPSFVIGSSTGTRFIVTNAGNVGVGTTSPVQQLSVGGKLFVGNGAPTGMGTATSTFQGDVLITGKLDVSTIDPVYTIDGVKYATYGLSSIGVKEEMSTTITLDTKNTAGKYEHVINFSEVEEGSDLWLFYQVTTFGDGWKDLVANLTPGFDGSVHYVKDPATNTLRIIGDAPGEVSVRLVSSRFDAASWPNLRPDQNSGFAGFQIQSKK